MLIECPECGHKVSDRAKACVECGFPIREHVDGHRSEQQTRDDRQSRERVGETDCPHCEARGFVMVQAQAPDEREGFYWCSPCKHTGRVALFRSSRGYWAVAHAHVNAFANGEELPDDDARFVGAEAPAHRYDRAGPAHGDPQ